MKRTKVVPFLLAKIAQILCHLAGHYYTVHIEFELDGDGDEVYAQVSGCSIECEACGKTIRMDETVMQRKRIY
jgi:hypothetical protein